MKDWKEEAERKRAESKMAGRGRERWNAAEFLCIYAAQTGTYAATWQKCQLWPYHWYVTKRKGLLSSCVSWYIAVYCMHNVLISVMLSKLNLGKVIIAHILQRKKKKKVYICFQTYLTIHISRDSWKPLQHTRQFLELFNTTFLVGFFGAYSYQLMVQYAQYIS